MTLIGSAEAGPGEGRPPSYNAVCDGTTDDDGLYGEGIIDAAAAVARAGVRP